MADKSDKSKAAAQTKHIPKDAQVMMSMLKDMGITDYEPRVVNQLLEYTYRYVTSVLDDARLCANHAKKKTIDADDVKAAVNLQLDKTFTTPLQREMLLQLARAKNVTPLPPIRQQCGLRLPPDRYCLSACNYKLKPASKKPQKTILGNTVNKPNVSKIANTSPAIKRPVASGLGKTSTSNTPKPVFKFSAGTGGKVIAKPAMKVSAGPTQIKMEVDIESAPGKRKHDSDDYDNL